MWTLLLKIPALIQPLLGALTGLNFTAIGQVLDGVWLFIVKNWQIVVIVILLLTNAGTFWLYNHTNISLVKEKASHASDIASFKKAQADADSKAQAEKVILQKESKADADQADANYATLFARYKSSLLRYSANQSGTKSTSDNQLPSAQGGNGPSENTKLSITVDDAQICAENTARLQAVHDWAITLPKEATN
jgi:hypothetical protein